MAGYQADGFVSLARGVNTRMHPLLLEADQMSRAVNVSIRGGLARTRSGFVELETIAASGTFQGAYRWSMYAGDFIAIAVSGHVYVYDIHDDWLTDVGLIMSPTAQCYFSQVDQWLVVQDGTSRPSVLEMDPVLRIPWIYGSEAPDVCLSIGTVMTYAHRRIHYIPAFVPKLTPALSNDDASTYAVVPDASKIDGRTSFVSSDIRRPLNPEYVFRMSEYRDVDTGSAWALPQELGFITAMDALRGASTGTGVGALLVFGRGGLCAFDVGSPRDQWSDINFSQVLFTGVGTVSPRGVLPYQNDMLYIDTVGHLRTIRYDTHQMSGGGLSVEALSVPLADHVDRADKDRLEQASTAAVDNKILWTLDGTGSPNYFRGLGALDLAPVGLLSEPVAFDGIWTGFRFLQVLTAKDADSDPSFYAVVQKPTGEIVLLQQDDDAVTDPDTTNIQCTLITKLYSFNDLVALKMLQYCDVWVSDIETDVAMTVYFRPYGYPVWTEMSSRTINFPGGGPQTRRRLRFPLDFSSVLCDPITQRSLASGGEFQFAIRWTGSCCIDRFRAVVETGNEEPVDQCADDNENDEELPTTTGLSDYDYEVWSSS